LEGVTALEWSGLCVCFCSCGRLVRCMPEQKKRGGGGTTPLFSLCARRVSLDWCGSSSSVLQIDGFIRCWSVVSPRKDHDVVRIWVLRIFNSVALLSQ
jgi:hypothetical protein